MRRTLAVAVLVAAVPLVSVLAACGSDDGADVRSSTAAAASSGGGSGSRPGSGTGISLEDTATITTKDPLVLRGVAAYKAYVTAQTDRLIAKTTVFTDAVRAGDLEGAKAAYAPSREPWERIEPIAALIADTDGAVDSRVDDFASPDDPDFTGWHRIEYLLWEKGTTEGAAPFADRLDAKLRTLRTGLRALDVPPAAVAQGAADLVQEVSEGKITGEEDRYSKTDLWDFAANVEGSRAVVRALAPALKKADPGLLAGIQADFRDLERELGTLRRGDGYVLYCLPDDEFPSPLCPRPTVTAAQIDSFKGRLAGLSEELAEVPGALRLEG
jgi:iron uptake system component EfeO